MIPHVLLTPTNFCFHDKVITSLPGVLGIKWSPLNIAIANQKYEPTQRSIYSFVCYQFAIYFYVGSIREESTEDMEKKNFDLLQLIILEIMRILLAFSYFPTYSEIWSPPDLPLHCTTRIILKAKLGVEQKSGIAREGGRGSETLKLAWYY